LGNEASLKVFDIQGFSVHDGPGIRQTIFLQGCPLKCLWCHSPESQAFETKILWLGVKCIGCLKCTEACPTGARTAVFPEDREGAPKIVCDWNICTNCGACVTACPANALYYCGVDHAVDDLMKRIKREKSFYDKSGGGVTVSGGECLCQSDGVKELFGKCKEIGVNTAADTCGLVPWSNIEKVLPYTDIFLYDIKHMNSERHAWATGVPNELILENARKIAAADGRFHIRIPLVQGYNDDEENIKATCSFLLEIKDAIDLIQILPFHNYGEAKYERLSMEPPEHGFTAPSEERIASVVHVFEEAGFKVILH